MGNILIIAYHFPPHAGSSGSLRTLKYCRYLPAFGWQPTVLTAHARAYDKIDEKSLDSIPRNLSVIAAFALDTKKHMGIGGRYFRFMALPDRWVSWVFGGVPAGLRAVREHKVGVLYSTFPIMSAALIGYWLRRFTGLPWVLDLRDPMSQVDYPRDALARRVWAKVERAFMRQVSLLIFSAEATRRMYLERYPEFLRPEMCVLISNGYDEADFLDLQIPAPAPVPADRPVRLVHSGLIYPIERDPRPMFSAVERLKKTGRLSADKIQIVFRAPGSEDLYRRLLADKNIEDLIVLEPPIPYLQALQECADADGLLLFQAADCDMQIPAKAYEYLRIGKPVLAFTTRTGDTAALLREVGGATIVNIASEDEIYDGLSGFVDALRAGTHPLPDNSKMRQYTREVQAGQLAKVLDRLTGNTSQAEKRVEIERHEASVQALGAKSLRQ